MVWLNWFARGSGGANTPHFQVNILQPWANVIKGSHLLEALLTAVDRNDFALLSWFPKTT
jgi:hypothetical protein